VNDRFEGIHLTWQLQQILSKTPATPPRKQEVVIENLDNLDDLRKIIQEKGYTEVAIDTETDGLHFLKNRPWCITCSFDGKTGYFIDTRKWLKGGPEWQGFADCVKGMKQVWANGKFDIKFFRNMGGNPEDMSVGWDVVAAAHVLNELPMKSKLKTSAWIYTTHGGYQHVFDYVFDLCKKSIVNMPWEILREYAAMDAIVTFLVYRAQSNHFAKIDREYPNDVFEENGWPLLKYYEDVVLPTTNMFVDIEERGMLINKSMMDTARTDLGRIQRDLQRDIQIDLCRGGLEEINIDSGIQLGKRLAVLGWETIVAAKGGYPLTNAFCLGKWAQKHKLAQKIIEYRKVSTLLKTYVGVPEVPVSEEVEYDLATGEEILPEMSDPTGFYQHLVWHPEDQTWRVHPTFWAMLATTGRNRCSEPNLQNIPKRGKLAGVIRKFFDVPGPDWYLGEWDASGLQLRIVGALSQDRGMFNAFLDPVLQGDLHSLTGHMMFCPEVPFDDFLASKKKEPYAKYRQKAKACNFSLVFNTTAFAFARSSLEDPEEGWTLDECIEYVEKGKLTKEYMRFLEMLNQDTGFSKDFPTPSSKADFAYYWTTAADLKRKFFKQYSGVDAWIKRYIALGKERGYVRSIFGSIRRTPYIQYEGKDTLRSEYKTYLNNTVNSPVQAYEAVVMMQAMVEVHNRLKSEGMKSRIVGNVHDSCVLYVYKPEAQRVFDMSREAFERVRPENKGVPMTMEMDVADVRAGVYWGSKEAEELH
jgi:DNA polymerase-1